VDAIAPQIIYDIKTMNLILKVASSFFVGWFRLASLGAIAIAYAWYWLIPRINKRKSFMTPDEHRREAQRLRRERPDNPEAQSLATAHEQIAKTMERVKFRRSEFWWLLFFLVAMFAIYALLYWGFI
jgi:drug/metabolite transporter (DMT)-like permease